MFIATPRSEFVLHLPPWVDSDIINLPGPLDEVNDALDRAREALNRFQ